MLNSKLKTVNLFKLQTNVNKFIDISSAIYIIRSVSFEVFENGLCSKQSYLFEVIPLTSDVGIFGLNTNQAVPGNSQHVQTVNPLSLSLSKICGLTVFNTTQLSEFCKSLSDFIFGHTFHFLGLFLSQQFSQACLLSCLIFSCFSSGLVFQLISDNIFHNIEL